jgi:crotonobetainyl-CoA:carnitine CoA-transferase CaiB-like acyl-CoA transferase
MIPGSLSGTNVLEINAPLARYTSRLFAMAGADVVKIALAGSQLGTQHIYLEPDDPLISGELPTDLFFDSGKRCISINQDSGADRELLRALTGKADVILTSMGLDEQEAADLAGERILAANPAVVFVAVTPFGLTGPWAGAPATDLTVLAAGGFLNLAGDDNGNLIRPYGDQSMFMAGLHAWVAALSALEGRRRTGAGLIVDVSAQESVAHSLENAVQFYDLENTTRGPRGSAPVEAGTGLYQCGDGSVYMVAGMAGASLGWPRLVNWLKARAAGPAAELDAPEWQEPGYRGSRAGIERFGAIFAAFARDKTRAELYDDGQSFGVSIAPLLSPAELPADKQLTARQFFESRRTPGGLDVIFPGPAVRADSAGTAGGGPARAHAASADAVPAVGGDVADVVAPDLLTPLSKLVVVDMSWVGAGPYVSRPFAIMGADVIKIETITRPDPTRLMRPARDGIPGINRSGYYANRNPDKRSIAINLKTREGIEAVKRLIAAADVLITNFRPGVMTRLGLDWDVLRGLNPRLIYLEMPMQGTTGPHASYIGYGLTLMALSGLYELSGDAEGPPIGTGTNYPDHVVNPLHSAGAILCALRIRNATGAGVHLELSQLESTVQLVGPAVISGSGGHRAARKGNHVRDWLVHDVFPCDGGSRKIAIAVQTAAQWRKLTAVLGAMPVAPEPGMSGGETRALREAICERTILQSGTALAPALREAGIPAALVEDARTIAEENEQLKFREHWTRLPHAEMGDSLYDALPYRFGDRPLRPHRAAALLGEHTREVCAELLGMSAEQVATYQKAGVLS